MKHPTHLVATAFCALALIIFAKFIALDTNVGAQQESKPKFRPAGPNAINPRPDEWEVAFKTSLSIKECDQEIDRILSQYGVKLMLRPAPENDKPARYPHFHAIYIIASAERAKQIAEDEAVESVTQNQNLQFEGPNTLGDALQKAGIAVGEESRPESIEEYKKSLPQANMKPRPQAKRQPPGEKPQPKSKTPDSEIEPIDPEDYPPLEVRATGNYNLDRIDSRVRAYDSVYNNTNDGSREVDIYFFDSGMDPAHPEFLDPELGVTRVRILRNPWPENYLPNPVDHGTMVASAAVGLTTGVANRATPILVRVTRGGNTADEVTPATFTAYINAVRQSIFDRRPNRAIVSMSIGVSETAGYTTTAMRTALTNLMNDTQTPVFVAIGQLVNFNAVFPPTTTRADFWPQNHPGVITVGMSDSDDDKVDYQFACCVPPDPNLPIFPAISVRQTWGSDLFAPAGPRFFGGNGFTADQAGINLAFAGTTGYFRDFGSSFAAPQAAGWAAMYYSQFRFFIPTLQSFRSWLFQSATSNIINQAFLDPGDSRTMIYARAPILVCRNAASYAEGIAPDSFAACFPGGTQAPALIKFHNDTGEIAGTSGYFTSPSQINIRVPSITPNNAYGVRATTSLDGLISWGATQVNLISPGIFTLNSAGTGIANAQLYLRDKVTDVLTGPFQFQAGGNQWNPATHYAILAFYGTGWRHSPGNCSGCSVQLDQGSTIFSSGIHFPLAFIGAVPGDPALDQFNIGPLPDQMGNMKGTWIIKLFVGNAPGQPTLLANLVQFKIN
jgi:uncharacterized protein (TIGR03437 family)